MKTPKQNRNRVARVLGLAILAAAWLITGPDVLANAGITGTLNELLAWTPAMIAFFYSIADKRTLACERRAFMRMIGK